MQSTGTTLILYSPLSFHKSNYTRVSRQIKKWHRPTKFDVYSELEAKSNVTEWFWIQIKTHNCFFGWNFLQMLGMEQMLMQNSLEWTVPNSHSIGYFTSAGGWSISPLSKIFSLSVTVWADLLGVTSSLATLNVPVSYILLSTFWKIIPLGCRLLENFLR